MNVLRVSLIFVVTITVALDVVSKAVSVHAAEVVTIAGNGKDDHQILMPFYAGVFTKDVKYDSEHTGLGWKTQAIASAPAPAHRPWAAHRAALRADFEQWTTNVDTSVVTQHINAAIFFNGKRDEFARLL